MPYQDTLAWAQARGFTLHPAAARRCVNNVWGLYAVDDIPEGEAFARFPRAGLMHPDANGYPANTSASVQHIHAAAKAQHLGNDERFFTLLSDPLEYLEDYSVYFLDDREIQIISEISPVLGSEMMRFRQRCKSIVASLCQFDPSIPEKIYTQAVLNFNSRAVGQFGFVPLIDCFNHSASKGLSFVPTEEDVAVVARQDIKQGEQLYVSYGDIDLFRHAVQYNYYDPNDTHYVEFTRRVVYSVPKNTVFDTALLETNGFTVHCQKSPISATYSIAHPDALLSTGGPSKRVIELAVHLSKTLYKGEDPKAILLAKLDQQNSGNRVHTVSKKYLTGRLKRFYAPLVRDKHILERSYALASKEL